MSAEGRPNLLLSVSAGDDEEADRSARRLLAELRTLGVAEVRLAPSGELPDRAKAVDPVSVGQVLVTFGAAGGLLTVVVGAARDWLVRQKPSHKIIMTIGGDSIELENPTGAERETLIAAYLRRHEGH